MPNLRSGAATTAGACAGDIDTFCLDVKPGEKRISDCLSSQEEEEDKGNVEGVTSRALSYCLLFLVPHIFTAHIL